MDCTCWPCSSRTPHACGWRPAVPPRGAGRLRFTTSITRNARLEAAPAGARTPRGDRSMSTFARDKSTWATYGVFALLGFVQSSLGPILPTLREELDFSYALGGLHLSTFALGALLASVAGPRVVGALGLDRVLWLSVCGMAGGGLLFGVGRAAPAP